MLDLKKLKTLHDKAFDHGQTTREKSSAEMVFYFITQWDDSMLADSQLAYRGEFNLLKKAGRQILSDLAANPVSIDFEPISETRDDAAELADGLYRKNSTHNASIESFENAKQETVVCGVGAWELFTEYVSNRSGKKDQVIKRRPIFEANNNCFWDPNSKFLDKSDANYVSILTAYSEDGYKDLVNELTGEEIDTINPSSFSEPEQSFTFPWISGDSKKIYVVSFYHRKKIRDKILTLEDPFGQTIDMREISLKDVMDEMLDAGYSIVGEKKIDRWEVTKYVASGEQILDESIIPGEYLPIIPMYGEHAYIEGEEHYEGITRLAMDPQRLRNFQLSFLADITSRSPRVKPIYYPEQIAGHERMYEENGADNNYPYVLQNSTDANGKDLTQIPTKVTPEQTIPQALIASIELSRGAVEDVANPGLPQDIADPDLSGKAVLALQNRLDMQSMVYQMHYKHSRRRDAEVWASMAPEVYDIPRKEMIEKPDGSRQEVEIMNAVIDNETGDVVWMNDLRNAEFEIYSKIGHDYSSQKEQTAERLKEMIMTVDPGDPMRKILQLKLLMVTDGVEFDDVREYANNQLILEGIKKPETDEEKAMLEQAQNKPKEPDANMILAQGELLKGQAAMAKAEAENAKTQVNAQNEGMKRMIDRFEAMTSRMEMQIKAQQVGVGITKTQAEKIGTDLDNAAKIIELDKPQAIRPVEEMSDEELFQQLAMG